MKPKILCATIVLAAAVCSPAGASTLWMQFEGGGNVVTLAPSGSVNVEIWLDLLAGDPIAGLAQELWPLRTPDEAAYPNGVDGLVSTAVTPYPIWRENSLHGVIGTAQYISTYAETANELIEGPGSFLLAVVTIHKNDLFPGDTPYFGPGGEYDFYPIMFGGDPTVLSALTAYDGVAAYEPVFSPPYAGYSGYYTWGQGASAISGKSGTNDWWLDDDPLKVYVPEPASMCLLVLGGLLVLRRR